jgi:choline dehydrogenase-like flavoprotein
VTGPAGTPPGAADVAIIGAGVVGTAIARELARYDLSIVVVDAATDVGTGTTKANTAILHTGFDAVPGSLESRLVRRGSALLRDYATRSGIPVERTGALLVAWTAEQRQALPEIEEKARQNGYTAIRRPAGTSCCAATSSGGRPGWRCGRATGCWPRRAPGWCPGVPPTWTPAGWPGRTHPPARSVSYSVRRAQTPGHRPRCSGYRLPNPADSAS